MLGQTPSPEMLTRTLEDHGFVALSAILLIVLIGGGGWVIRKLIEVIGKNNDVIAKNTEAANSNTRAVDRNTQLTVDALNVMQEIQRAQIAISTRFEEWTRR